MLISSDHDYRYFRMLVGFLATIVMIPQSYKIIKTKNQMIYH